MAALKEPDKYKDYGMDPKELNNTQYILKDVIQGDLSALNNIEDLDVGKIKKALNFLLNNEKLDQNQQLALLQDSWRVNYRAKPPTPEEFVTEKYLGPAASNTYPWVKQVFKEFMNPTKAYRNLILYPHIGWGKDQPLYSKVYTNKNEYKLMNDIQVGDKILSPDGTQTEVIGTVNWSNDDVYELEMDNGKTMRCGPHHLHYVSYRKDNNGNKIWETVETIFMINHPEIEFEFQEVSI